MITFSPEKYPGLYNPKVYLLQLTEIGGITYSLKVYGDKEIGMEEVKKLNEDIKVGDTFKKGSKYSLLELSFVRKKVPTKVSITIQKEE